MNRPNFFEHKKAEQNYTPPFARKGCGNCVHSRQSYDNFSCSLGGFYCHAHGICDQHEARLELTLTLTPKSAPN